MDRETAVKIVQRRIDHLTFRVDAAKGSEKALMFDIREKEALEFVVAELSPAPMAQEAGPGELWTLTEEKK